jgi:hypothetical protein
VACRKRTAAGIAVARKPSEPRLPATDSNDRFGRTIDVQRAPTPESKERGYGSCAVTGTLSNDRGGTARMTDPRSTDGLAVVATGPRNPTRAGVASRDELFADRAVLGGTRSRT